MSWHVIEVISKREVRALAKLTSKGYRCWLPLCKSREDNPALPLFPGYLFVELHANQALPECDPIDGLLGFVQFGGDSPAIMPEPELERLRALLAIDGGILILKRRCKVKKGEKLRVMEGYFAGHVAQYMGDKDGRVRLLLDILGKRVDMILPAEAVQPVS